MRELAGRRRRAEENWRALRRAVAAETGLRPAGPAWSAALAGLGIGLALALGAPGGRREPVSGSEPGRVA